MNLVVAIIKDFVSLKPAEPLLSTLKYMPLLTESKMDFQLF